MQLRITRLIALLMVLAVALGPTLAVARMATADLGPLSEMMATDVGHDGCAGCIGDQPMPTSACWVMCGLHGAMPDLIVMPKATPAILFEPGPSRLVTGIDRAPELHPPIPTAAS